MATIQSEKNREKRAWIKMNRASEVCGTISSDLIYIVIIQERE